MSDERDYDGDPNGLEFACCYPGRCLCPHPDHQRWECFTLDDVEGELDPDEAPLICACHCSCAAFVEVDGDRCPMCSEACGPSNGGLSPVETKP